MTEENYRYKSKIGNFEGPLELLLSLIEQRKLFINEISLAEVTNDYLNYLKSMSNSSAEKNISNMSYFVLVAATLILIKSKSLLPNLELTEDENDKIINLEKRLNLFQIIKEASLDIKNSFGLKMIFWPNDRIWGEPLFVPDSSISISVINNSINEIIKNLPQKEEPKPKVEIKKIINLEHFIVSLTERIQKKVSVSFKDFSKSHKAQDFQEAKIHIIVSFLAMLELVKEGIIEVFQKSSFDDIQMNKQILIEN
jgi:segregation and condensation protein A